MTKLRYLMFISFWVLMIIAGWVMSKQRGGWIVFAGWSIMATTATWQIIQNFKMKSNKDKK